MVTVNIRYNDIRHNDIRVIAIFFLLLNFFSSKLTIYII